MTTILALAIKDLRLLWRDKTACFFIFVFPLIFAVFFGSIFSNSSSGGASKISVALVDEDATPASKAFAQTLRGASELNVRDVATRGEAESLVLRSRASAYIALPAGFGAASEGVFLGRAAKIEVGIDPSRRFESAMLQGVMQRYAFTLMFAGLSDPGVARERLRPLRAILGATGPDGQPGGLPGFAAPAGLAELLEQVDTFLGGVNQTQGGGDGRESSGASGAQPATPAATAPNFQPVSVETRDVVPPRVGPTNAFAVSFPQGIMWGVIGCTMGFAGSLLEERRGGTLARLLCSPLSRAGVLLGKSAACMLTTMGVCLGLLLLGLAPPFRISVANLPMLALGVACVGVGFTGLMMFVACVSRSEQGSRGIGWGVMMVLAMIGGGTIPLLFMPEWLQRLSIISPFRWAVQAIEGGLWRGWGISEMALPCGVLLAIGATGFALGLARFRTV
jgi:ABC-2 type transport system permease protein